MRRLCMVLLLLLLLTACDGAEQRKVPTTALVTPASQEAARSTATPVPTEEPIVSLHWIDEQNSAGCYRREAVYGEGGYGRGGVVAHYFDFSNATEQIIGEPLNLETANLYLFADENSLYWTWSGMVNDTPILLRSNLDGSNREPLYTFPQGTAVAVWDGGMASDGTALYFRFCHISDDPTVPDGYELVRLNPGTGTLETLTQWNTFGGNLLGVWENQLLITRTTLAEDCPVEPVYSGYRVSNLDELSPWLTISLCAFNPATRQEKVLYTAENQWFLDRRLGQGALWKVDEQYRLVCRPLGQAEDKILAQLPKGAYIWGIYAEDVLLHCTENEQTWLYVYHQEDGSVTRSPRQGWYSGELQAISIVGEAGPGQYLVIEDGNTGMQQLADSAGTQYLIDGYARYGIASREALLDTAVPMTQVTRPGTT